MYTLYKQDIIFIIILDRVPPSLNKLYYYYYYYHCLPTPTSRVCTGRCSLIWEIGWGCAARFKRPLPYFRPNSVIFPTQFQTLSPARDRSA